MWRLDPAPILCFDGDSAGQKAAIRAALARPAPPRRPSARCASSTLPAGQDPDDLVRTGGRDAIEALLAEPGAAGRPPVAARARRRSPSTTPEARAGLRQRLIEHSQAIGDPGARPALPRRMAAPLPGRGHPATPSNFATSLSPAPGLGKRRAAASCRPKPPAGAAARADRRDGHRPRTLARALLLGFANFPEASAGPCASSSPPFRSPIAASRRIRDRLVDAAVSGETLDREALATILATSGAAADLERARRTGTMAFSFTRRDTAPERAVRDLGTAIDALMAAGRDRRGPRGGDRAVEGRRRRCASRSSSGCTRRVRKSKSGWRHSPAVTKRRRHTMAKNETAETEDTGQRRCAADRSQRGVDQEADRPRQEARLHHL